MYETHWGMSKDYEVSCEELDFLATIAKECGVTGSRIMGGGFGGCTINLVKEELYDAFIEKAKAFYADMRRDVPASYKSQDTEEPFDKIFTKPLGYLFTRFFIHIKWTPNMVTILSMFIGVIGGILFYPDSFGWNLVGVLLDVMRQVEATLLQKNYDGFMRKSRNRSKYSHLQGNGTESSKGLVALWIIIAAFVLTGAVIMAM